MAHVHYMEELVKKIEKGEMIFLDDDSEFVFSCKQCGKCCHDRNDILISPHDFFHMVKATGKEPEEVIERYTNVYVGASSHMTVMQLRYRNELNGHTTCYFLGKKDGKYYCRIQDHKPFVCRAYPLGRMTACNPKEQDPDTKTNRYFLQDFSDDHCIGEKNAKKDNIKQQVTDWLGGKEKKKCSEKYNNLFHQFYMKLFQVIDLKKMFCFPSLEIRTQYYNTMFFLFYLKYDFSGNDEDFLKQYEENTKALIELSQSLATTYPKQLKPKETEK